MSITNETLNAHKKDPAILCCQRQKGLVISADDLEDPTLFEDMEDAGILSLTDDGLSIEQVIGMTLTQDVDALTPILPEMLSGVNDTVEAAEPVAETTPDKKAIPFVQEGSTGAIHIEIDKLEGLKLDIPGNMYFGGGIPAQDVSSGQVQQAQAVAGDKVIRTLKKRYFLINDVTLGDKTAIENGILTIDKNIIDDAIKADSLVKSMKINIIKPSDRHVYVDTIMDVCPIAVKAEGALGSGITNVIDGAVFVLTGVDEDGTQIHEFGSSEGYLGEKMAFGNPGCADADDIIIHVETVLERLTGMERRGPYAAHKCEDVIIQAIRSELKNITGPFAREEVCKDKRKSGKPRVVLIKEIMGQGAMHDNILCPTEPCGVLGGQKNVDLGNVPLMLSPNEVRDGGIHALTCIGPATKEMTRHYFREPLVEALAEDEELALIGVIFVGSPQVNDEKMFVSERLGAWIETMSLDGAVITTEGFGNNHIDFTSHIGQIGRRDIPVVGVSFCAYQGQLVVGNEYADAMIEINKDENGFENEIAGYSGIDKSDAARAVQMLKNKMMGIPILPAPKKWTQEVVDRNKELIGL